MNSMIEKVYTYANSIEYGWTNPQSLIVCVPVVAEIIHAIQLRSLPQKKNGLMFYQEGVDQVALSAKLSAINFSHALGAIARVIMWTAIAVFTKNDKFRVAASFAFCHYLYSIIKAMKGSELHLNVKVGEGDSRVAIT
ncbi:MAG: hypothetical protein JWO53_618 [Chlamydiia bacterium]|nr:hypothetical protein [Chlamydiia bacterium]